MTYLVFTKDHQFCGMFADVEGCPGIAEKNAVELAVFFRGYYQNSRGEKYFVSVPRDVPREAAHA